VDVDAQRQRCARAPLASSASQRAPENSSLYRWYASFALATASLPFRSSGAPASSSRRSASVSTRETKKLATDATGPGSPLEPAQVRLDDLDVALQREDQRHVDRPPARDHLLDRRQPFLRRRNLDVAVRPVDELVQPLRLDDRPVGVECEVRIDLDRDPAVLALAGVPHLPQQVAGVLHVLHGEPEEDLLRVVLLGEHLAQLLVVGIPLRDRLLEDRRVRRHADHRVLLQHPRELPALQHLPREEVDPDALAELAELVKFRLSHRWSPFPSPRSSQAF
jgi:hypothetical protein